MAIWKYSYAWRVYEEVFWWFPHFMVAQKGTQGYHRENMEQK